MRFDYDPGNRDRRLRYRDEIRRCLTDPGTKYALRRRLLFTVVMMRLNFLGMRQCAAGTQHNQHRINRDCTDSDGTVLEYPTEALHFIGPLSHPSVVPHLALRILNELVHQCGCAVYLQMPTHATHVTSHEIVDSSLQRTSFPPCVPPHRI